jgi:hypothetical protein
MNSVTSSISRVSAAAAVLLVTSCAMPPRDAWRQIQSGGLIPYMMGGGAPLSVTPQRNYQPMVSSSNPTPKLNTSRSYASTTPSSSTLVGPQPPSMLNSSSLPVASNVSDLPGYVRSPYTNPPRLVDVRGMSAGAKVVCPYTQKPFLVPGSVRSEAPAPKIASTPRREAPLRSSPPPSTPASANENLAALNKPATITPPSSPSAPPSQPKVDTAANTTPAPSAPSKPAAPELPYGASISGRPGFVNSPYAAKHQLVDVTGLPVGMEVKCPYTGKLFRVPPQ